jgi:hypothetical protein
MRNRVKTGRLGMVASNAVGTVRSTRLSRMPRRRSRRRPNKATARPPAAMPMVVALTAKPIAAGLTP